MTKCRKEIKFTKEQCSSMLAKLQEIVEENSALQKHQVALDNFAEEIGTIDENNVSNSELVKANNIFWKIFEKACVMVEIYINAGNYDQLATPEIYRFMGSRLFQLKKTDTWRGKMQKTDGFKKEEKEALHAMVYTMFCVYRQEVEQKPFNRSAFIGHIFLRILKKAYTWDAKPYNKSALRNSVENYDFWEMLYVIKKSISETNLIFVATIYSLDSKLSKEEKDLFTTVKAVVNKVEFNQINNSIFLEEQEITRNQVNNEWDETEADKYAPNKIEALLERISWGRNTVRWQGYAYVLDCNILAHMLETAVFAWLMALESNDVERAERAFFVGLFHDLAELWTDDIPSPCKDSIYNQNGINIRGITGQLEKEALDKMFYPSLNPMVAKFFKEYIIFEDVQDESFYRFIKDADYFSADYELWWNLCEGSRENRFREIIKHSSTLKRTPATQKVLEDMIEALAPIVLFKP